MINSIKNYELVLSGETDEERLLLTFEWDDLVKVILPSSVLPLVSKNNTQSKIETCNKNSFTEYDIENNLIPKHAILDEKLSHISVVFENNKEKSRSYIVNFINLPIDLFNLVKQYTKIVIVSLDYNLSEEVKIFTEIPLNITDI